MIRSFRHKGLAELFNKGRTSKVRPELVERVRTRLNVLREATKLEALNIPGFDFHPLRGKAKRYSIHVNGPWCIVFEWDQGEAVRVDLVQYH